METIDCPHRSLSSDLSRLQVENKKHLVVAPRNGIAGKGKVLLLNVTRHSCALQVLPSLQYSQSADSSRPHSTATDPFSHVLSKSELLSLQSWNNVPSQSVCFLIVPTSLFCHRVFHVRRSIGHLSVTVFHVQRYVHRISVTKCLLQRIQ